MNVSQFRLHSCIAYDTITVFRHVYYVVWILLRWHKYAPLETVKIMMGTRDGGVFLVCELLYRILVISLFMSVAAAEDITYIYWYWHIKNSHFSLIRTAFSRKVPF